MKKTFFIALTLLLPFAFYFCLPFHWLPDPVKKQHYQLFGLPAYKALASKESPAELNIEDKCPIDAKGWRKAAVIDGIKIKESPACLVDNPSLVAAAVKGTNNIDPMVLMESRLTPDAIIKGKDLDGDGDPDEIHIKLEVIELNGSSQDIEEEIVSYNIAPGLKPGLWVFAPKSFGMSTENFESLKANPMLRAPSPAIRVEQGDKVTITLENTHYTPHTIHFHGVDHPFLKANGEGNDGVPQTSEKPLMPGKARSYEMQPRQTGTMWYHCHVQPHAHILMGLQGMFIIEENRPNNWVQTINPGAGHVRHQSIASKEQFDMEYDLHYQSIDQELNDLIKESDDPRVTSKSINREYDITDAKNDFFLLNGKSFPYTAQETIIVVEPDQNIKLRVLNGSDEGIAIHTHGHKFIETHADGVEIPKAAQLTRDVGWIAPAQRADYILNTTNNGLHSYGEGVWLMHDHIEKGVTSNGIAPGGNVTVIVYKKFLGEGGFPLSLGVDWNSFFVKEYYQKLVPVWKSYDMSGVFSDVEESHEDAIRMALLIFIWIFWLYSLSQVMRND